VTATRRSAMQQAGAVALSFGVHGLARGAGETGASIIAVRVWPAEAYTRVTIESDMPLSTVHSKLSDPPRLSIDIDGLELSQPLKELVSKVRADDPFIGGVRVGQFKARVVRLVLDLKQAANPQVFTLQPVAAYKHRLVFDLYPAVEADPLLALLREKAVVPPDTGTRRGTYPSSDPLGDVIAKAEGRSNQPTKPNADSERKVDRLIVVALDPGHGGEDPGAIGPTGLREKDVVLAIALQLRDKLNTIPNMRAFLTRDADYFVPLNERVRKARRVQADLFVSIHADAFDQPHAAGASVFALSDGGATSAAAKWMAAKENAADSVGGVNVKNTGDTTAIKTILAMSTAAQIKDSLKLGGDVLGQLERVGKLHKPRVEQAGFAVLKAPDVPSILVETAFISNPDEEAKLRDVDYQTRLVDALHNGIKRYFAKNPPLARQRPM
jgi:N-acetylmuramoyl-L-alanine amidase